MLVDPSVVALVAAGVSGTIGAIGLIIRHRSRPLPVQMQLRDTIGQVALALEGNCLLSDGKLSPACKGLVETLERHNGALLSLTGKRRRQAAVFKSTAWTLVDELYDLIAKQRQFQTESRIGANALENDDDRSFARQIRAYEEKWSSCRQSAEQLLKQVRKVRC
jgi:hypothetical protein